MHSYKLLKEKIDYCMICFIVFIFLLISDVIVIFYTYACTFQISQNDIEHITVLGHGHSGTVYK